LAGGVEEGFDGGGLGCFVEDYGEAFGAWVQREAVTGDLSECSQKATGCYRTFYMGKLAFISLRVRCTHSI
jgi:hypothetical protein